MAKENPESELKRLFKKQDKALEDEVFRGVSSAERAQYDRKLKRINELTIELSASAVAQGVRSPQRPSRSASGTKNLKPIPIKLRLISPTAAEKKTRRTRLQLREKSGQRERASLLKKAASKNPQTAGGCIGLVCWPGRCNPIAAT